VSLPQLSKVFENWQQSMGGSIVFKLCNQCNV
jgi:hypothetical protein